MTTTTNAAMLPSALPLDPNAPSAGGAQPEPSSTDGRHFADHLKALSLVPPADGTAAGPSARARRAGAHSARGDEPATDASPATASQLAVGTLAALLVARPATAPASAADASAPAAVVDGPAGLSAAPATDAAGSAVLPTDGSSAVDPAVDPAVAGPAAAPVRPALALVAGGSDSTDSGTSASTRSARHSDTSYLVSLDAPNRSARHTGSTESVSVSDLMARAASIAGPTRSRLTRAASVSVDSPAPSTAASAPISSSTSADLSAVAGSATLPAVVLPAVTLPPVTFPYVSLPPLVIPSVTVDTPAFVPGAAARGTADGPATTVISKVAAPRPRGVRSFADVAADWSDTTVHSPAMAQAGSLAAVAPTAPAAAIAAPTAAPAAPADPAVHEQVSSALTPLRTASDGLHALTVRLHPADLGPVVLVAHLDHGNVNVELNSTSDAAHQALSAALPDLHRDLQAAGFQSVAITMAAGGLAADANGAGSGTRERAATPSSSRSTERPSASAAISAPAATKSAGSAADAALDRWL